MSAFDFEDMILDLARLARKAITRKTERNMIEQKGEAFAGLPTMKRFILPTIPAKAD